MVLHNPKRRRVEIKNPLELCRVEIEAYSIMAQVCINCPHPHCHEPFLVMLPQKRRRVEIESPVEICHPDMFKEIESPDMFKEIESPDMFKEPVNDAPTIVDAVGASIILAQGASGRSGKDQGTNGVADAPFTDICTQQPASFGIATIIDSEETQDSGVFM